MRLTSPRLLSLLVLPGFSGACFEQEPEPPVERVSYFRTATFGKELLLSRPVDPADRSRSRVRVRQLGDQILELTLERTNGIEAWVVSSERSPDGTETRRTRDEYGILTMTQTIDAQGIVRHRERSGKTTVGGCAAWRWTADELGRVTSRACLDRDGRAVVDLWGCHESRMTWTPEHDLSGASCFDPNGRAVADADGVHRTTYQVDAFGDEVERSFFDIDGAPVEQASDGCAGWQTVRDEGGHTVGGSCLNQGNLPTAQKNSSHAGWSGEVNANGCLVERTYIAVGGRPATRGTVHQEHFAMDQHCNVLDRRHLDREGRLVSPSRFTPARTLRQWNDEGLLVRRECFGTDGAPVGCTFALPASEGASVRTYEYDDAGRVTTERNFNVAGEPTVEALDEYPHATHITYDEEGRETRWTFSDAAGEPAKALKVWAFEYSYDGLDAVVSTRYLGAEGELIRSPILSCAELRSTYDHLHRLERLDCLGTTGEPIAATMHWNEVEWRQGDLHAASVILERDDAGSVVANAFVDTKSQPLWTTECTDLAVSCYR